KTITFKPNIDANGYEMPNATFRLNEGDLYTLVGIEMPQTYIDAAESQLQARTVEALNEITSQVYDLEIDEKYMRDNGIVLRPGDRVTIRDAARHINEEIRV